MNYQIAEPTTALQFVIEAAIKVKEWKRDDIEHYELQGITTFHKDGIESFSPLSNNSDAWLILDKLMSRKLQVDIIQYKHGYAIALDGESLFQEDIPECLRADGIDPLKALMVWAAWRWL